ncbi:MAG: hypothetical protein GEU80_00880 [Dehalococcoidia bacterium]|nr:hypothetical protein [Dehalococcoidia bacterium]
MLEVIPFVVGAVVLLWAAFSAAHAFSGGPHAGHHVVAPPPAPPPSAEEAAATRERRRMRSIRLYQIVNFALAFGVLGAVTLMIIGALIY